MMQMVGAFAEFEREMIRERTKAGLDAARKEGKIGGRRPKLNQDQRKDIADNVISERNPEHRWHGCTMLARQQSHESELNTGSQLNSFPQKHIRKQVAVYVPL